jgi:hypothetical protein
MIDRGHALTRIHDPFFCVLVRHAGSEVSGEDAAQTSVRSAKQPPILQHIIASVLVLVF